MITRTCDRCGKIIQNFNPMSNAVTASDLYPMFSITVKASFISPTKSVDLCHECSVIIYDAITKFDMGVKND